MLKGKGLQAVARWIMSESLLSQVSRAKEQIDRVKGRVINDGDNDGDGDDDNENEAEAEALEQEEEGTI